MAARLTLIFMDALPYLKTGEMHIEGATRHTSNGTRITDGDMGMDDALKRLSNAVFIEYPTPAEDSVKREREE